MHNSKNTPVPGPTSAVKSNESKPVIELDVCHLDTVFLEVPDRGRRVTRPAFAIAICPATGQIDASIGWTAQEARSRLLAKLNESWPPASLSTLIKADSDELSNRGWEELLQKLLPQHSPAMNQPE